MKNTSNPLNQTGTPTEEPKATRISDQDRAGEKPGKITLKEWREQLNQHPESRAPESTK